MQSRSQSLNSIQSNSGMFNTSFIKINLTSKFREIKDENFNPNAGLTRKKNHEIYPLRLIKINEVGIHWVNQNDYKQVIENNIFDVTGILYHNLIFFDNKIFTYLVIQDT